ncbi:MAG: hypothetical protein OEY94_05975 [Alphaproteobacteria bacterium]|nr:hypothetical protein [Alphaproteobacteria bacterium]
MSNNMKQKFAAVALAAFTTFGCVSIKEQVTGVRDGFKGALKMAKGPGENATDKERKCHEMASDGVFMSLAMSGGIGGAGGAALGAVSGGSVVKGAAGGAALGLGVGIVSQGKVYLENYKTCMEKFDELSILHEKFMKFQESEMKSKSGQGPQAEPSTP